MDVRKKETSANAAELDSIIDMAGKQPGIAELVSIMNQTEELRKLVRWYLDMMSACPLSVSTDTSG